MARSRPCGAVAIFTMTYWAGHAVNRVMHLPPHLILGGRYEIASPAMKSSDRVSDSVCVGVCGVAGRLCNDDLVQERTPHIRTIAYMIREFTFSLRIFAYTARHARMPGHFVIVDW